MGECKTTLGLLRISNESVLWDGTDDTNPTNISKQSSYNAVNLPRFHLLDYSWPCDEQTIERRVTTSTRRMNRWSQKTIIHLRGLIRYQGTTRCTIKSELRRQTINLISRVDPIRGRRTNSNLWLVEAGSVCGSVIDMMASVNVETPPCRRDAPARDYLDHLASFSNSTPNTSPSLPPCLQAQVPSVRFQLARSSLITEVMALVILTIPTLCFTITYFVDYNFTYKKWLFISTKKHLNLCLQ